MKVKPNALFSSERNMMTSKRDWGTEKQGRARCSLEIDHSTRGPSRMEPGEKLKQLRKKRYEWFTES